MGYYTRFTLNTEAELTEEELEKATRYSWYSEDEGVWQPEDECKWHDWEKDMKKLSLDHKGIKFYLSGEGEESGDIWEALFLDGKGCQSQAEIIIPELKEEDLK